MCKYTKRKGASTTLICRQRTI